MNIFSSKINLTINVENFKNIILKEAKTLDNYGKATITLNNIASTEKDAKDAKDAISKLNNFKNIISKMENASIEQGDKSLIYMSRWMDTKSKTYTIEIKPNENTFSFEISYFIKYKTSQEKIREKYNYTFLSFDIKFNNESLTWENLKFSTPTSTVTPLSVDTDRSLDTKTPPDTETPPNTAPAAGGKKRKTNKKRISKKIQTKKGGKRNKSRYSKK